MAFEISSTLLFFLTKEIQELRDGKVEKIYQLDKENIIFRIYKEGKKKNFRINTPTLINITKQEFETPTTPPRILRILEKIFNKRENRIDRAKRIRANITNKIHKERQQIRNDNRIIQTRKRHTVQRR